jgi:hypothetical protein
MKYPLGDGFALIRGDHSFLLVARVPEKFALCIETFSEEYCQGLDTGDLVVVSAPEGGDVEPCIMLAEMVRRYHMPLLVLPKDHPGSRRLRYVLSAGPEIVTSCSILRGTHPEQHLLCSHEEFAGMVLSGTRDGFSLEGLPDTARIEFIRAERSGLPA